MRLMKYSFVCPICDRSYYTYIEQKKYQEIYNDKLPIEDIFKDYPDYYQKMIKTSICQSCQHNTDRLVCINETDSRDEIMYNNIVDLV